jgi:hypothetical protein
MSTLPGISSHQELRKDWHFQSFHNYQKRLFPILSINKCVLFIHEVKTPLQLYCSASFLLLATMSQSSMDPADQIEVRKWVTFPRTNTTWNIISRRSAYPESPDLRSDSFHKAVIFDVVIAGTSAKLIPDGIPRTAILKVQSLSVSTLPKYKHYFQQVIDRIHTITDHTKKNQKNFRRTCILPSLAANELVALEQLTLNGCDYAPTLLDAKVQIYDVFPQSETYVCFILMTTAPGIRIDQDTFWSLPQQERDLIRRAFREALSSIHASWVIPLGDNSKHLAWDREERKMYVSFLSTDALLCAYYLLYKEPY